MTREKNIWFFYIYTILYYKYTIHLVQTSRFSDLQLAVEGHDAVRGISTILFSNNMGN